MATRVLVIYASSHGQTARIATALAEHLRQRGLEVDLHNARQAHRRLRRGEYDGIVAGGSLIARGQQPPIRRFVRDNLSILNESPSAFFQVSASAGSAHEAGRAAATRALDRFLAEAGWRPSVVASIAGAINYTKYNFLLRWYMQRAARVHGGETDTSRDHEYTDWNQVAEFADQIAGEFTATGTMTRRPAVLGGSGTQRLS